MIELPTKCPLIRPDDTSTDATTGKALLQVPPSVGLVNAVVLPTHTVSRPSIGAGSALMVTLTVEKPQALAYVIKAVPPAIPVTSPPELTVATPALLLLHVPPLTALESIIDCPAQMGTAPVMASGAGFTVTFAVVMQPGIEVYVIVVVPSLTPVISPVPGPLVVAVAFAGLLLLQVPPKVVLESVVVPAVSQTVSVPVIGAGNGFTVMSFVTNPQPV